jgi:hypothetical protein
MRAKRHKKLKQTEIILFDEGGGPLLNPPVFALKFSNALLKAFMVARNAVTHLEALRKIFFIPFQLSLCLSSRF